MSTYLLKASYKKQKLLSWNKPNGYENKIAIHLSAIISTNLKKKLRQNYRIYIKFWVKLERNQLVLEISEYSQTIWMICELF